MRDALPVPPRRAPLPVLGRLIEPLYRAGVARRNARFDAGRGVNRFRDASGKTIPVISIGNLSVGGTGKTPMVMHTLRLLLERGRRPCVAMRGYSKSKDGAADETDAYRRAFASVAVVAQPDRAAGVRALLEATAGSEQIDCIVLDDGFQHRQIARDLDVVLIDATPGRSVFEDRLLPAGWLREPVGSLRRAGAVVLTHAELASAEPVARLKEQIRKHTAAPIAVTRHLWVGLSRRIEGKDERLPLEAIQNRRVVGCCAIGHPEGFRRSLERTAGGACEMLALPDHDPFRGGTVERVRGLARAGKAEYIVVTDKDWSKLRGLSEESWPCPVVRPELALAFDEGGKEFEEMVVRGVGGT